MVKPEWGMKHRCTSCGKPFYDMNKDPITCPACGTEHKPEKLLKSAPTPKKEAAPAKPVKADDEEGSGLLLDDDEILEEEDVDLPDDDGDDDLSGVVASPKMENEDL